MKQLKAADVGYEGLRLVADVLERPICWLYNRAYHFTLQDEWSIAITPESAGRFRIELCRWTLPRTTLWALADDGDRLAAIVRELASEVSPDYIVR